MKHKQTKATDIPPKVMKKVEERDSIDSHPCCVNCGSPNARGWCHFVSRKQGGMGIEENLWTGCQTCHDDFDKGNKNLRDKIGKKIEEHLRRNYPNWSRESLVYDKWKDIDPAYRFDGFVK
jgi:5-methylcytosine-specific restriction endonuclease McrA